MGHNETWERLDFEERYREFLRNPDQRDAVDELLAERDDRDARLVCHENTGDKR